MKISSVLTFLIFYIVISFSFFGWLSFNFVVENKKKEIQIENLSNKITFITQELYQQRDKVSLLEHSVNPKDRQWALIKRVRQAIQDTIKNEGYKLVLNINELTALASHVVQYSDEYDVPLPLVLALMRRESAFNPLAISHAGAQGLMQVMPETAKECALDVKKEYYNIFKIKDNIQLGTWYLRKMLSIFNDDVGLAVRAYNAGPTYVKKVLAGDNGFSNYPQETIKYHEIVMKWKEEYEKLGL